MLATLSVKIAAVFFWSFQLAPQAYTNWKAQSTEGLSSIMVLCWTLGSLATAIYCIGFNVGGVESPIFIAQPNLFMLFSIICWSQCIVHSYQSYTIGIASGVGLLVISLIIEVVGGYYMLQNPTKSSKIVLGCLTLIFFAIGYIPQFKQIYDERRVSGLSLIFLAFDMLGAALSIVSLAIDDSNFNPITASGYIVVLVCDMGIVLLYWLLPIAFERVKSSEETVEVVSSVVETV